MKEIEGLLCLGKESLEGIYFKTGLGFNLIIQYNESLYAYRVLKDPDSGQNKYLLSSSLFERINDYFSIDPDERLGFASGNEIVFKTLEDAMLTLNMWFSYEAKDLMKILKADNKAGFNFDNLTKNK